MNDIDEILAWHKQTFPEFSSRNQETKLNEEIGEYHAAIDTVIETGLQSDLEKVREELADVIIAAINMMRYPEIQTLVKDKMATNKGLGKMDTTTDYKALYLKKFFEWQEICGKQRAQIEELEKKLDIAVKALKHYAKKGSLAEKALAKIKEIK